MVDLLVDDLTNKIPYSGDLMSDDEVALLDKMCVVAEKVQLGSVINDLLEKSAGETPTDKITDAQAKLLNGMCFGAERIGLGTLLQWCADRIEHNLLSDEAKILTYSIPDQAVATIDSEGFTIDVTMPLGTNVTELVATFTISGAATISVGAIEQVSATTANDFTDPVVYTVTSESGDVITEWTVSVTVSET